MIIVKISDGLGNQLFQYSFARALKERTGYSVYLDARHINNEDRADMRDWMSNCGKRIFGLHNFQISLPIAGQSELSPFTDTEKINLKLFRYCKELWLTSSIILSEKEIKIIKGRFSKRKNYYIYGYFCCQDYMQEISDILLKELKLKEQLILPESLETCMNHEETVSIHVRRGYFLKLGRNISDTGYYFAAVHYMKEKIKNPVFLIFSDDIEWVKNNLPLDDNSIYISEMGFQDYEELILMSMCRNNIIANSTFSYWGAWLNDNPSKLVTAPKGWRRRIIPDEWVRL